MVQFKANIAATQLCPHLLLSAATREHVSTWAREHVSTWAGWWLTDWPQPGGGYWPWWPAPGAMATMAVSWSCQRTPRVLWNFAKVRWQLSYWPRRPITVMQWDGCGVIWPEDAASITQSSQQIPRKLLQVDCVFLPGPVPGFPVSKSRVPWFWSRHFWMAAATMAFF